MERRRKMINNKTVKERLEYIKICDEALKHFDIKPKAYFTGDKIDTDDHLMNNHAYYALLKERILFSLLQDEEFKKCADELMNDYKYKPTFL